MAWLESHQELREHPKTKRLCRLLSLNRREAVGLLHFLWWWAYDYASEGDLSGFTDEDIADALDWEGDARLLVDSLSAAGFVTADRQLHDWYEYAQKWLDRRRANAERQKQSRDRRRHPIYWRDGGCCRYCGVVVPIDDFVVDHVFPFRRGGGDQDDNLATACGRCNTRKNNRTPEEAGMPLRPVPPSNAPNNRYVVPVSSSRNPATGPDSTGPDSTGPEQEDLPVVVVDDAAAEPPSTTARTPSQATLLRQLSAEARELVDYHRQCHGRARAVKLNPAAVETLEEAVADLGTERLKESIRFMAGKLPPVPELSKAITAARTHRTNGGGGPKLALVPPSEALRPGSLAAQTKTQRF